MRSTPSVRYALRAARPAFRAPATALAVATALALTGGAGGRGAGGRGGRGGAGGPAAPARNKVGLIDLRGGPTVDFDDVQSFSLSRNGAHAALRRYRPSGGGGGSP